MKIGKCPKCQGAMEKGAILDYSEGPVLTSSWIPESEVPAASHNKSHRQIKGKFRKFRKVNEIAAYSCKKCGFLECYAPRKK